MARLDLPSFDGSDSLEEMWDDWFASFDESRLARVDQEKAARGERGDFEKGASREGATARVKRGSPARAASKGSSSRAPARAKADTQGSEKKARGGKAVSRARR